MTTTPLSRDRRSAAPWANPAGLDHETCYRAVSSRDARFDGLFFTAVRTTGIYCRPSCPATTPRRRNVEFHRTAAAAQLAGFRACRRCRPDTSPGSPEWNVRADVVGRAMRLIADGTVDRAGVGGLATSLGYSERQLHRMLTEEVGAGAQALARAQRAHTARTLIETTALPFAEVAFAAGFASIRQFNDTVRLVFAATPRQLRADAARRPSHQVSPAGTVRLRLPARQPFDRDGLLRLLAAKSIPGLESVDGHAYRRGLALPHGEALATVILRPDGADCDLALADPRDVVPAVARLRRLLDLDADASAITDQLGSDPVLGAAVATWPGGRVPGAADGFEVAVRAVVGQQVSVAGARAVLGRLVMAYGKPVTSSQPADVGFHFPTPESIAGADPTTLPMPRARGRTLVGLAAAVADGQLSLDAGADRDETTAALLALPGIGPWTAAYVRMRALGDPDILLATDLGVRRAAVRLGLDATPAALDLLGTGWAPWRSYATHYLWHVSSERPTTDVGTTP